VSGPGEGDLDLTEEIRARGLLADGRPVVAMLSGGRDSVCLLDLAAGIAGPSQVIALHVNYALREGAGQDEALCRQLCAELGVGLEVVNAGPSPGSGNLQAWARDLRYAAAREMAGGAAEIATGHTATDQVETILYRLAAAPSRRALLGMVGRDGQLIRPLLSYTREQTAAHCRARGLPWREDPSNDTDRFARGRVRSELVPALRRVHPAAEANVLAVAEILRQEGEMLDELVAGVLRGRDEIPLAELRQLALPLVRLVLQRLADAAAGGPAPGTARRAAEILALGNRARLDLPHGVQAVVERGRLSFSVRS
jgi:tRNA(Ile)-lysidine synthase